MVPDEQSAISIAEAVWEPIYPAPPKTKNFISISSDSPGSVPGCVVGKMQGNGTAQGHFRAGGNILGHNGYIGGNLRVSRCQDKKSQLSGSITGLLTGHADKIRCFDGFCFRCFSTIQNHFCIAADDLSRCRKLRGHNRFFSPFDPGKSQVFQCFFYRRYFNFFRRLL